MRAKPAMKPWVRTDKSRLSSVVAALQREHLTLSIGVPPLWDSINVFQWLTQGTSPGLCRSIALTGLFFDTLKINVSTMYSFQWVRGTRWCKCAHLLKWVPRTYFGEYVVLILMFPKAIGDRATQITTSIPFLYSRVLSLCCSYIYIIHSKHS